MSREASKTLRLLASEGDDDALTALKVALSKERPWVRQFAGEALLDLDPAHQEDVLPIAIDCLDHPWYRDVGGYLVTAIAKARFETALVADPDNRVALFGLARCQRNLGEDATDTLDRLIQLDPFNSWYSLYRDMPQEEGNPEESLELLKMADAINP